MSSFNLVESSWSLQWQRKRVAHNPSDNNEDEREELKRLFEPWEETVMKLVQAADDDEKSTLLQVPSISVPQHFLLANNLLGTLILAAHDISAMKVVDELRRRAVGLHWSWYLHGSTLMPIFTLLQTCPLSAPLVAFEKLATECRRVSRDALYEPYCWLLLVQYEEWLVAALRHFFEDKNGNGPTPQDDDPVVLYISYRLLRRW